MSLCKKKDSEETYENVPVKKEQVNLEERDQWSSKLDFILSCVGYAIGKPNFSIGFCITLI